MVVLGCVAQAFVLQSVLGSDVTATRLVSRQLWSDFITLFGGNLKINTVDQSAVCDIPFLPPFIMLLVVSGAVLSSFAMLASVLRKSQQELNNVSLIQQTCQVAVSGWRWWLLPWLWAW